MNKFIIIFLSILGVSVLACNNDDESPIPDNAITINLMNNDGQAVIGGSDVHINSANNFTSHNCGIADWGRKNSFNQNPNLSQIAQEVAVTPGNYYQIVLAGDIKEVAGQRALPIDANFYNVYVDSWIYDNNNEIAGAKVFYTECYPKTANLPDWNTSIEVTLKQGTQDESATYSFNKSVQISSSYSVSDFEDSHLGEYLDIMIQGNSIKFSNAAWAPGGKAEVTVLVRYESVYTRVRFIVNSSI